MAIDPESTFINTNNVAYPDTESVNASGPTATDGTEFVKAMIDNYMFGPQQALLNYAGLIPDGFAEADGASQELTAMKLSFGYPGEGVVWYGNLDPATVGARVLLLQGQGILVASFPELFTATYIGDGDNATADAFFRADDAGGAVRNIAGIYLIMPDARGRVLRGIDSSGTIDPDGIRLPGDSQEDAYQGHWHQQYYSGSTSTVVAGQWGFQDVVNPLNIAKVLAGDSVRESLDDGTNGTPRVDSETRMKNIATGLGIRY